MDSLFGCMFSKLFMQARTHFYGILNNFVDLKWELLVLISGIMKRASAVANLGII